MKNGLLQKLRIIYMAMAMGQVMFIVLVIGFLPRNLEQTADWGIKIPFILGGLSLAFIGEIFHRTRLSSIRKSGDAEKARGAYLMTFLTSMALWEFPTFILTLGYWFSGDLVFLILAGLVFIAFLSRIPFKAKVMRELGLSDAAFEKFDAGN